MGFTHGYSHCIPSGCHSEAATLFRERSTSSQVIIESLPAKQRDAEADTSALERELDKLVYALYGLTPEEVKLVEGATQ